jgi:uroporphyrinogen-III synthase
MSTAGGAILITRPEPAAHETAVRLAAMGHVSVVAPFLIIARLSVHLPRTASVCVITSANAAHAIPPGVHVFAVGDATAARASAVTTAPVHSAAADAAALAELIAASCDPKHGPLLLLSGQGQGLVLAADLRTHGFRVLRRAVYRAVPPHAFPALAAASIAAGTIGTALFFSPETARVFATLCPADLRPALSRINALTLSPAISRELASLPWRSLTNAAHPSLDALFAILPPP